MFSFHLNVKNPFSKRWEILKVWSGSLPVSNKYWEAQVDKVASIFSISFSWTVRQNHPGIYFSIAILGYDVAFNLYDSRHWDPSTNSLLGD